MLEAVWLLGRGGSEVHLYRFAQGLLTLYCISSVIDQQPVGVSVILLQHFHRIIFRYRIFFASEIRELVMKIVLIIHFIVFVAVFQGPVIDPVFALDDSPVVKLVWFLSQLSELWTIDFAKVDRVLVRMI